MKYLAKDSRIKQVFFLSFVCAVCTALNCSLEFIHGILFISILVMVFGWKKVKRCSSSNSFEMILLIWWWMNTEQPIYFVLIWNDCAFCLVCLVFFFYFISTMLRFYSQRNQKERKRKQRPIEMKEMTALQRTAKKSRKKTNHPKAMLPLLSSS